MRGRIGRRGDRCGREINEWANSYNYLYTTWSSQFSVQLILWSQRHVHNGEKACLVRPLNKMHVAHPNGAFSQDSMIWPHLLGDKVALQGWFMKRALRCTYLNSSMELLVLISIHTMFISHVVHKLDSQHPGLLLAIQLVQILTVTFIRRTFCKLPSPSLHAQRPFSLLLPALY